MGRCLRSLARKVAYCGLTICMLSACNLTDDSLRGAIGSYDDNSSEDGVDDNRPPIATSDIFVVEANGSGYSLSLTSNDIDPDGDSLTVVSLDSATKGTITNNNDGTVTYTPDADFYGAETIAYQVSDGVAAAVSSTLTIQVLTEYAWLGTDDSDWTEPNNWCGPIVGFECSGAAAPPSSSDAVVFTNVCTNCDTATAGNLTLAKLIMTEDYTGTLTQSTGHTMTVTTALIKGGSFQGGDGKITIKSSLKMTGGQFTSTSGELDTNGDLLFEGGSFSHNSGRIEVTSLSDGTAHDLNFTAGNLQTLDFSARFNSNINILSDAVIENDLSMTSNHVGAYTTGNGHTFEVRGNLTVGRGYHKGNRNQLKILLNGSGNQVVTGQMSTVDWNEMPHFEVDKTSGNVTFAGHSFVSTGDFLVTQGTVDLTSLSLQIDFNMTDGDNAYFDFNDQEIGSLTIYIDFRNRFHLLSDVTVTNSLYIATHRGDTQLLGPGAFYLKGNLRFGTYLGLVGRPATFNTDIHFIGTGDQTYSSAASVASGDNFDADITINKASGTFYQAANLFLGSGDLMIQSGDYEIREKNLLNVGGDLTISSGVTFAQGCGSLSYGSLSNGGTMTTSSSTPNVSALSASASEGDSMSVTVELSEGVCAADFTADYDFSSLASATLGTDFDNTAGTITITNGAKTGTITVPTIEDAATEGDETFQIDLSTASHGSIGTPSAIGTIVDDD